MINSSATKRAHSTSSCKLPLLSTRFLKLISTSRNTVRATVTSQVQVSRHLSQRPTRTHHPIPLSTLPLLISQLTKNSTLLPKGSLVNDHLAKLHSPTPFLLKRPLTALLRSTVNKVESRRTSTCNISKPHPRPAL